MFPQEKLSQVGQKYWCKFNYSNTLYGLEYEKTVSINSFKMFIKKQ